MTTTPEQLAEDDRAMAATGREHWAIFARHIESGRYVGFTDVAWHPANPDKVNQGGTGVMPEHRGHALGKWLKAAMIQKVLDERPEAKRIRTSNAYSNDAMLGINTELGFREVRAHTMWQAPIDKTIAYLEERGIAVG